ncbi:hypothetical protein [Mesorhizobium sp. M2C.T.Ca.TU.002.02.1.1]|uniref:hypothetical protein n=1 Tax=Mesorhizobium sp. M2C.T.Ca.TU.002.02.1.1 TaxID=2496788 RepID=UPI000FCCA7E8|nr:hypothetical protein [Mesorhizobium sp. M2C.T.Ca.TU.002.02.1.1]RUU55072.1 hypothetical protein EOD04_32335 [Mesorhizobium sp. M2C.T.Ca.TU.009.01.2.1]RUU57044.1 hypothetical protein EOD07_14050 [Mesorhizobium sp. M2C.T.Ca.TU.002.02.1.1]
MLDRIYNIPEQFMVLNSPVILVRPCGLLDALPHVSQTQTNKLLPSPSDLMEMIQEKRSGNPSPHHSKLIRL